MKQKTGCLIKIGYGSRSNFDSKMNIVTKFQVPIFKNYKVRRGVTLVLRPTQGSQMQGRQTEGRQTEGRQTEGRQTQGRINRG